MAAGRVITLRLTIRDPVPGVAYSLQNKRNQPEGAVVATDAPLSFDIPVLVAEGPRFLGEYVRSEGPERRFIYIAVGRSAGDADSLIERRAKIDIHTLPHDLIQMAIDGAVLEARLPGRAGDGGPACATVRPLEGWQITR